MGGDFASCDVSMRFKVEGLKSPALFDSLWRFRKIVGISDCSFPQMKYKTLNKLHLVGKTQV